MIIDFHTHIFPDKIAERTIEKLENLANIKAFTDGTEKSLLESMEKAGVDVSVILPVLTRPEQFNTVNEFAARLNEKYAAKKKRLLSFGGIHPKTLDYKRELRIIKDLGLKGIKLHPDYQAMAFDDISYMRILDYASELGLISVVHAGVDVGYPDDVHCTPKMVLKVLESVAPDKMVLAHYGGFKRWDEVEELLAGKNVYFDNSFIYGYIEDEKFLAILKKHGADKVVFGTDSPWSGQKESIEKLNSLPISKEDKEKILGGNAKALLQLRG